MSDIRKNLTLSAQLDDSQLRKQLEILKKEMGNAFSVDAGSLNDLKSSIRDVAKEFGSTLRKELEGIKGQRGKTGSVQGQKSDLNLSGIDSIQVREMQVTNMIVNSIVLKGSAQGLSTIGGVPESIGGAAAVGGGEGGKPPITSSRRFGGLAGSLGVRLGAGLGAAAAIGETYEGIQEVRRTQAEMQNRFSRDLEQGLGVQGISREAGRGRFRAGAFGALAGGARGAAAGAALLGGAGAILGSAAPVVGNLTLGGLGAAVGGIGGGILGGVRGAYRGLTGEGELTAEQTALLADAEARARAISPLRQQMMAGGGVRGATLTDQMKVGARQFGMSAEDSLNAMLQARETLGNKGAAESFNQILGNQRFLGIGAGTTAQAIETMAGAGGESRMAAAAKQADVIKKGVAAGLDVSKSGKFLQSTMQYLQTTVGLGRVDTEAATNRIAAMTQGLAGAGPVTDVQLQQAQNLAQLIHGESSSIQGISGAANINQIQQIAQKYGGLGTGTTLALAGMSSNAREEDILSVLTEGQRTGEVGRNVDLAKAVKDIQSAKRQDSTLQFMNQIAGGNQNLAFGVMGAEQNFQGMYTTESLLGRQRAAQGQITPGAIQSATEAIEGAKAEVQKSPEFQLDVAQFTRSTESASKGLETFTTVTEQMANQMRKLLVDLEAAQKRFADASKQTGYSNISR